MAEKKKNIDRDQTLINVLERMADQIQKQDSIITELVKQQNGLVVEVANAEFSRGMQISDVNVTQKGIQDAIARYRSDMLSLVHEQDSTNKQMNDMRKLVDRTAYSLELNTQKLSELDNKVKAQEKTISDHYAHSLKQAEALPKETAELGRNFTRMHADTEKRLVQMHEETQRQLDKLKQETIRRLMALNGIESALQTLLIRTEPPEKKPLLIVRIAKKIEGFIRIKLPLVIKKIRVRRRNMR